MGRASILIDKVELTNQINSAESTNTFDNLFSLCSHICNSDWAKTLKNSSGRSITLTPSVVYQRINQFSIPTITKPGKRGRIKGQIVGHVNRKTRATKFAENKDISESIAILRKNVPSQYQHLVDKIEKGSGKACIRVKCLDCVNYTASLISDESCKSCPLYPLIYKKKKESTDELQDSNAL